MSNELKQIQKIILLNASPEGKAAHKKFVPGAENIYGVRMPILNKLAKQYKSGGFGLIEELWKSGTFEEKILAVKILEKIAKQDPEKSLALVQLFAINIGNWAVCDAIGMQGLKSIVKSHQKEIFDLAWNFNSSKDFWQRRLSLVLVEWFTRKEECHPEIKRLIKNLEKDDEYYVKKAVVWIKRNLENGK